MENAKRADLIRLFEAELDVIENGGYGRPAGRASEEKRIFDQSLICINHWFVPDHEPGCHEDCALLDAVPREHKAETLPCHFIPLNDAGETVASLEQTGDRDRLQEEVKRWLRRAIARLKEGAADNRLPDMKY